MLPRRSASERPQRTRFGTERAAPEVTEEAVGNVNDSQILWALSLGQLPASLYEELRGVAAPVLLFGELGTGRGAALGLAHLFLLELVLATVVSWAVSRGASWRLGRPESLRRATKTLDEPAGLGRMLLLAVVLNMSGLAMMLVAGVLASGHESRRSPVHLFVCGHVTYSLGSMIRDVVFPTLATCFSEEVITQLNAHKHVLMHTGALIGGGLIAAGFFRCYLAAQFLAMLMGVRALLSAVAAIDQLKPLKVPKSRSSVELLPSHASSFVAQQGFQSSHQADVGLAAMPALPLEVAHGRRSRADMMLPPKLQASPLIVCTQQREHVGPHPNYKRFSLLVLARFVQSWGFAFTSPVMILGLLRARGVLLSGSQSGRLFSADGSAPASLSAPRTVTGSGPTAWAGAQLLASASVSGHVAGLAVNLCLGQLKPYLGIWQVNLSGMLYAAALASLLTVVRPDQFIVVSVILRGSRSLGKATSDALAFRVAAGLGPQRVTALFLRRQAFKLGLLAGKYSLVALLASEQLGSSLGSEQQPPFALIFGIAAATAMAAVFLQSMAVACV
ncbi:unnamed protein product [Polarella glacialis]|uniref:Uncharacterized protein n=1 Tax=Polarella glacialis TaxID=89957 RepID=A0A813JN24_POLGL|nr:unnamed protein product [Polarella glacialis]